MSLSQPTRLSLYFLNPVQLSRQSGRVALVGTWYPARVNPPHIQKPTYQKEKLRIVFSLSWLIPSRLKRIVYFREEAWKRTQNGNYLE